MGRNKHESIPNVLQKNISGLDTFAKDTRKNFIRGILLYGGKEVVPFGENLWAWPMSTELLCDTKSLDEEVVPTLREPPMPPGESTGMNQELLEQWNEA